MTDTVTLPPAGVRSGGVKRTIDRATGYVPADLIYDALKRAEPKDRAASARVFAEKAGEGRGRFPTYISGAQIDYALECAANCCGKGFGELCFAELVEVCRSTEARATSENNERVFAEWASDLKESIAEVGLKSSDLSDPAEMVARFCDLSVDEIVERIASTVELDDDERLLDIRCGAQIGVRYRYNVRGAAEDNFEELVEERLETGMPIFEGYDVDPDTLHPTPPDYFGELAEREAAEREALDGDVVRAAEANIAAGGLDVGALLAITRATARDTLGTSISACELEERMRAAAGGGASVRLSSLLETSIEAAREGRHLPYDDDATARRVAKIERLSGLEAAAPLLSLMEHVEVRQIDVTATETEACKPTPIEPTELAPPDTDLRAPTTADKIDERRQLAKAEAKISANPQMSEFDLLKLARGFARETSLIPVDTVSERLLRASGHCTEYMRDAVRLSVKEARHDAVANYDDDLVEARVRDCLARNHAPITGEAGLREVRAERAQAGMAPAGADGPTPFKWRDPHSLPRRAWLYGTHLIRKELSATIAPGGGNKTSLCLVEALALASGRPLLGIEPEKRCRVWWWSGEEPFEELQRRILAACDHYGLTYEDIEGWLFVDNFESFDFVIAEQTRDGTRIFQPKVDLLVGWLLKNKIDALFIDPAISTHNVGENDNVAIQKWATAWKAVAVGANVAISIAHHAKKLGGMAATADDARGARSFVDKTRVSRSLNPMTKEEAERFGIHLDERRFYFSTDPTEAKANMAPAVGGKSWFRSVSVLLGKGRNGNLDPGESVGVVERWRPPAPADKLDEDKVQAIREAVGGRSWRAANNLFKQADHIGAPIAQALGLDLASPSDMRRVKYTYARLIKKGDLVEEKVPAADGKPKPFARWADDD